MTISASDILSATKSVTKSWTRQRRAEERGRRSTESRGLHAGRVNFTDVADEILPGAYTHASGDGKYPVAKRQFYYACREEFKQRTGRELPADYFSNTLLVQYVNRHPEETASWKLTSDPRGTLTIPNTSYDVHIPCGTLAIGDHLRSAAETVRSLDFNVGLPMEWPSVKHGQRYQAVVFIEKEGFAPLLEETRIAERFDVVILSCKGQSVVAARRFVDAVCSVDGGVPLLVVHDFDKAGFEISQRLTSNSEWAEETDRVAYNFINKIQVADLGLRLVDAEKYELACETVTFKGGFGADSIATSTEQAFLRSNRRIELNAFTSPQFIEWLETKLTEQGLAERLIPDDEVLVAAYRRAIGVAHINHGIAALAEQARRLAEGVAVPTALRRQLQQAMRERPAEAWDRALYALIQMNGNTIDSADKSKKSGSDLEN